MFINFPIDKRDSRYDFVIIGAGVAGLLLAERLSEVGRILIVEMGNLEKPYETGSGFYEIESIGNPIQKFNSRIAAFGGSSNHWEGNSRPFSPKVFANRPGIPGWPIRYAEYAQYLPKAEKYLNLIPHQRDDDESKLPHPLLQGHKDLRIMYFQHSDPLRKLSDQATTEKFSRAEGIDILLNTRVVDIILDEGGRGVDSVQLLHRPSGKTQNLKIEKVILSAGGVENPRLMLSAARKYPHGNPLSGGPNELTGKWFSEHPRFRPVDLFFDDRLDLSGAALARTSGWFERWYLSVTDAFLKKNKLPRFGVTFIDSGRWADESVLADANNHFYHQSEGLSWTTPSIVFEQTPIAESQVKLSGRMDENGFPLACVNWQVSEEDINQMKKATLLFCGLISQHGVARCRLTTDADIEDWTGLEILPGCHHMGATRMASDSLGGVVDINSKVFGLHNMYVAGSSIFPSCDWVNPTLNLTTMTARLADHLVRKDAGKINTMVFKDGSQKMDGLSNGWSTPEMEGTWSDGNQAEINITASGARELILRGRPYADTQVTMVVNGRKVYAGPCGGLLNTIFQLDGQPELNIVFTFTNLTTPESLGENDDTRELGLFLTELQIR